MDTVQLLTELRALRELLVDAEREYARTVASLTATQVELQTQLAAAHMENAELRATAHNLCNMLPKSLRGEG